MSVIRQDRTRLDAALRDTTNTVLLLSGDLTSDARRIHDRALETITDGWRKLFLFTDLSLLTPQERFTWFGGAMERFAVVGGDSRAVVTQGSSKELLTQAGVPSVMAIRAAYSKGDEA